MADGQGPRQEDVLPAVRGRESAIVTKKYPTRMVVRGGHVVYWALDTRGCDMNLRCSPVMREVLLDRFTRRWTAWTKLLRFFRLKKITCLLCAASPWMLR